MSANPPSRAEPRRVDPAAEERFWSGAEHASRFFLGESDVHGALTKLVRLLEDDAIPYAIAGAMALNEHGYRRVSVDVDVLLDAAGLARFKERHLGPGYVEKFPGSKGMRDTEHGVTSDVLLAGEHPGYGKPKPVRFPEPAQVAEIGARGAFLPLAKLVELKLASGMSAPHRLKELADVLEVIRALGLARGYAGSLDPWVRGKCAPAASRAPGLPR